MSLSTVTLHAISLTLRKACKERKHVLLRKVLKLLSIKVIFVIKSSNMKFDSE